MCDCAIRKLLLANIHVSDHYKTCVGNPWMLGFVPNHKETQKNA